MKTTNKGVLHFETESEVRNFMAKEFSSEKIRNRSRDRRRIINYHDPQTAYQACLQGIRKLDKRKHREGMQLLETIVKAAYERQKMVTVSDNMKEPSAKYYMIQEAMKLDKECVYQLYAKEWGYTIDKIKEIERKTMEAIGDKCEIGSHITMGESLICGV